jgi:hypothetical protein
MQFVTRIKEEGEKLADRRSELMKEKRSKSTGYHRICVCVCSLSEKSDWPSKAHKADNDREPCKPVIIYNLQETDYKSRKFPLQGYCKA